ncbi:MAG: deoxyguanosinetriphosphate triphosphohydrolase [Bacteroidota bacterium]|nr:deoxyguanosinetriphosphate triphosphohydrolase [Bacteroidota bacterium]
MMNWDKLLSAKRFGLEHKTIKSLDAARTEFQRDFDRIIFSSPFRRLQDKTQVFPLPGSVFVHNRLTHSLEVASVGRSLANEIANYLKTRNEIENKDILNDLGSIVSAACLAHDMGNPPFGHAGEDAISNYFANGNGKDIKDKFADKEWADLINFEGNANALRMLSHQFIGRRKGGFALTYSTIAALVKYPFSSLNSYNKKKYGFFISELHDYIKIAKELEIKEISENEFARHPLVYLVEAADDICYEIMDIEDAHKLNIISTERTQDLLLSFFDKNTDKKFFENKIKVDKEVTDTNELIAYLRASVIGKLISGTVKVFIDNYDKIMEGEFNSTLVDKLSGNSKIAFENCKSLAVKEIYKYPSVVKIELTGFNIIGTLLDEFINASLKPELKYSEKLLSLIPEQFNNITEVSEYNKVRLIIDFISGMTDLYAVKLYKDIIGINL